MVGGIVVVAIVVYLGLSALSTTDTPSTTTTTSEIATTTTASTSTTREATTTTTAVATTTTLALLEPAEISVLVLNGVGVDGLASQVSTALAGLGYQTLEPGNYEPILPQSRIWYADGWGGVRVGFPVS
jgi:hypothetical protein